MTAIPLAPSVPANWADLFFGPFFEEIFCRLGKFTDTIGDADAIVKLLLLPEGVAILDIPCGFGRYSAQLCAKGYRVVGVDSSAFLLGEARRTNPGPEYFLSDMRFPPLGPFAAVLNLWTSFGYFPTPDEDKAALRGWHKVLQPGGQLLMELSDLERALSENGSGTKRTTYKCRVVNDVTEEAWIDWTRQTAVIAYAFNGQRIVGKTRIYSRDQLEEMLRGVGFTDLRFYGGFDGRQKAPADRLVIQAKK